MVVRSKSSTKGAKTRCALRLLRKMCFETCTKKADAESVFLQQSINHGIAKIPRKTSVPQNTTVHRTFVGNVPIESMRIESPLTLRTLYDVGQHIVLSHYNL